MAIKPVTFDEKDIQKLLIPDTPAVRALRFFKRAVKATVGLALMFTIFFVLINSSAYWLRFNYAIKAKPTTPVVQQPPALPPVELPNYAPEILIPKISVQAPLALNVLPSQVIEQLRSGVVHYADTALPGQIGNVVVVGHSSDFPWSPGNYKNVFALLDKLVVGDKITVPHKTQRYTYEVIETKVVKPNDLSVLKKTDQPRLTLITCYPVGTAQKRLIIVAKLVEGQPIGIQTTEPLLEELPSAR